MFKKILRKTVGGTAVAGLVLTASPLVAAPQIINVACDYNSPVATQTALTLSAAIAPYGNATTAHVKVSSNTRVPSGNVTVTAGGFVAGTFALNGAGEGVVALPRTLAAKQTYPVTASYSPAAGCTASADTKQYTVVKSPTRVKPAKIKARAARLGKFKAKVTATSGIVVKSGKVVFTVKKNGVTVSRKLAKVRKGAAKVDGKNLGSGQYKIVMKYLGNKNFKAKKKAKKFRI